MLGELCAGTVNYMPVRLLLGLLLLFTDKNDNFAIKNE